MILSDEHIIDLIDRGVIGIDPMPEPEQIQPASLDIRLTGEAFHPASGSELSGGFEIRSGEFLIGSTVESISLPNNLVGILTGRSTFGRKGVTVHVTAGFLDPGFSGQVTTEMTNVSDTNVPIEHGVRGGQIYFIPTSSMTSGYDGQYQGQSGPTKAGKL